MERPWPMRRPEVKSLSRAEIRDQRQFLFVEAGMVRIC